MIQYKDGQILLVDEKFDPTQTIKNITPKISNYDIVEKVICGDKIFWLLIRDDDDGTDQNYKTAIEIIALEKLISHFEQQGQYSSRNKVQQYVVNNYQSSYIADFN